MQDELDCKIILEFAVFRSNMYSQITDTKIKNKETKEEKKFVFLKK